MDFDDGAVEHGVSEVSSGHLLGPIRRCLPQVGFTAKPKAAATQIILTEKLLSCVPLNKMVLPWSEKITPVAVSGLAAMAKHRARGLMVKAQKLDVVAGIQIRDAGISLIGGSLGG